MKPCFRPSISERVDHEGELALVIGKRCRFLNPQDAHTLSGLYLRQRRERPETYSAKMCSGPGGKNFDTLPPGWSLAGHGLRSYRQDSALSGQWICEAGEQHKLDTIGTVGGVILAYVSNFMTLEPGILVLTGTPSGVSAVQPGDVMTVEIEGLGVLRQSCDCRCIKTFNQGTRSMVDPLSDSLVGYLPTTIPGDSSCGNTGIQSLSSIWLISPKVLGVCCAWRSG